MKKLLLFLVFSQSFIVGSLFSADSFEAMRETASPQSVSPPSDTSLESPITVQVDDRSLVVISPETVNLMPTLKNLVTDLTGLGIDNIDEEPIPFPLRNFSSPTLKNIVNFLEHPNPQLSLDDLTDQDLIEIIEGTDFLRVTADLPPSQREHLILLAFEALKPHRAELFKAIYTTNPLKLEDAVVEQALVRLAAQLKVEDLRLDAVNTQDNSPKALLKNHLRQLLQPMTEETEPDSEEPVLLNFNPDKIKLSLRDLIPAGYPFRADPDSEGKHLTLKHLDLGSLYGLNEIVVLTGTGVTDLAQIESLDLGNNQLTTLKDDTFAVFKNLNSLNLESNIVRTINPMAFAGLNKLEFVSLINNPISRDLEKQSRLILPANAEVDWN